MSYQVLARKWRPKTFKQHVGQEAALRMLSNALDQQRLHHAYLFTGTRGVGKTTIARILAKCFNCESSVTATPCGACTACLAIDAGQFIDLYEVDAASRTKVEDTRELLENIMYPPNQGRYKIYLIDEVHMLSNHSFNALLKTLEEPPAHVKFLLATTDPQKLPVTILSRCLQFHLKAITPEQIASHLAHVCKAENVTHDNEALHHLAKAAHGSMRDALSLLDQAIAYDQGTLKTNHVIDMLGCVAQTELTPLLTALAAQDGKQLFAAINTLTERVPDFHQLLNELISYLHQLAITQIIPESALPDAHYHALATQFTPEEVQLYYQIALLSKRDLPLAATPQQGFTMTMLRMLAFKPKILFANVSNSQIEKLDAPTSINNNESLSICTAEGTLDPQPITALPEWKDVLPKLGLTGMSYALAANCTLEKYTDQHIVLALSQNHQPMLNEKLKERLCEALRRYTHQNIHLDIRVAKEILNTPIKQKPDADHERLQAGKALLMQDPLVQQLIEMYDATIDVSLVGTVGT